LPDQFMRFVPVAGVILIAAGTFLLWKRPSYSTRRDVVEIGEFKASLQQQEGVPLWVGAAIIALGVGCLLVGGRRDRS
jgi:hypothetical protein